MATVWLAADESLGREVAVKVLHPHYQKQTELVRRLAREGRAAAVLDHPNVLKVHDVGEGSLAYLVLELVRGTSLKEFLDVNGPPLAEVVCAIGAVIARALAAAHAAGVVHRDLKPANVLVAADGRLVLADFGMARVLEDDATLTASGALLGTPAFMSPEQALGQRADERSDLYALGATLYQLATGALPVSGAAGAALAATIRGDIVPPLRRSPRIGRDVARVIERLMAKEPAARPTDAATVAPELEALARPAFDGALPDGLRAYFADPGAWNAAALPKVLAHTLSLARAADATRAAAYLDRVLAFDPAHPEALALARQLASGRARRQVLAWSGGVALALAASVLGYTAWSSDVPAPSTAAVDALDAALAVAAATPDARGQDARVPEARPDAARPDAALARRRPVRSVSAPEPPSTGSGQAQPEPVLSPSPPDAAPAPPSPGFLVVRLNPPCDLTVDGAPRKSATPLELPAGPHTVGCTSTAIKPFTRTVTITSSRTTTLDETIPLRTYRVTLAIDATIDLKPLRAGTTIELTPGNHRVDAAGTTDYVPIPTRACTLRATPALGCY